MQNLTNYSIPTEYRGGCRSCRKTYSIEAGYLLCTSCFKVIILDKHVLDLVSLDVAHYLQPFRDFNFTEEMKNEMKKLNEIKQEIIQENLRKSFKD